MICSDCKSQYVGEHRCGEFQVGDYVTVRSTAVYVIIMAPEDSPYLHAKHVGWSHKSHPPAHKLRLFNLSKKSSKLYTGVIYDMREV